MKNYFFLFISMLFVGCATSPKLQTMMPNKTASEPLKYEYSTSFLSLPINIKLKDVENQINKNLNGLIYEDNLIEDDNITAQVYKTNNITIKQKSDFLEIVLPLKIHTTYRYGTEKLGIKLYDSKTFDLNANIVLHSRINLSNWKLKSETKIEDILWNESPSMVVLGKKMPITYLINPMLKLFRSKIEKTINEKMNETLDFKPHVLDALDQISKPTLTDETYQTWFRLTPLELYTKDAVLANQTIDIEMGLKCTMETLIGQEPKQKFAKNDLLLKPIKSIPNKILANIVVVSTYGEAAKIIQKNFVGQTFGEGNNKVTVNQVDLWHNGGKVVIALNVTGKVNGNIYLKGIPKYRKEDTTIYFDEMDFVLDTKNILHKSAAWLLSGKILKMIKEKSQYSIAPNINEGKTTLLKYLNNYSPLKGVFVNGQLANLAFDNIQINEQGFIAFLNAEGQLKIAVDGLE